jgi:hypothetical protein
VKWGGAVVCTLIAIVWVGSRWYDAAGWSGQWHVNVYAGCISASYNTKPPPFVQPQSGWRVRAYVPDFNWWFHSYTWVALETVVLPLWPLLAVSLSATAIAWRLDTLARRRAKLGACPNCSYSRTGLAARGVCPECGSAAPVAGPPA